MQIRKATSNNILDIVEFQVAMAKETENLKLNPRTVLEGVKTVFNHSEIGHYIVVEENNKIIACTLILKEWSDWRAKSILWIHSLYVLPQFRKRGIFKKIYEYLKNNVETSEELGGLRLYVDKKNVPAQKAYEAVGMTSEHYALYEWLKSE